MKDEFKGLPGIDEYLIGRGHGHPLSIKAVQHLVDQVSARTLLNSDQSKQIVEQFFEVIRSALLAGEIVNIRGLGRFEISSPGISNNKKRVFAKFKPKRSLVKRMNEHKG